MGRGRDRCGGGGQGETPVLTVLELVLHPPKIPWTREASNAGVGEGFHGLSPGALGQPTALLEEGVLGEGHRA